MPHVLILAIVVALVVLLLYTNSSESMQDVTPTYLQKYVGYWIYQSDDKLRKIVLSINYSGGDFLRITTQTTIRKWFPPVIEGNLPEVSPPERFVENPPLFRIIELYPDEILLTSIEPTYFYTPSHMKISQDRDHIFYQGKKFISSRAIDTTALKFINF